MLIIAAAYFASTETSCLKLASMTMYFVAEAINLLRSGTVIAVIGAAWTGTVFFESVGTTALAAVRRFFTPHRRQP